MIGKEILNKKWDDYIDTNSFSETLTTACNVFCENTFELKSNHSKKIVIKRGVIKLFDKLNLIELLSGVQTMGVSAPTGAIYKVKNSIMTNRVYQVKKYKFDDFFDKLKFSSGFKSIVIYLFDADNSLFIYGSILNE